MAGLSAILVVFGRKIPSTPRRKAPKYRRRLKSRPAYEKAITEWHDPIWREALDAVFKGQPSPDLEKIRTIATS